MSPPVLLRHTALVLLLILCCPRCGLPGDRKPPLPRFELPQKLVDAIPGLAAPVDDELPKPVMHGKFWPPRLDLGVLRTGALVQGRFQVFVLGQNPEQTEFKISAPPFIRIGKLTREGRAFHSLGYVACIVHFSVNTSHRGEFNAPIQVQVGKETFSLPVNLGITAPGPQETRVLVADYPSGQSADDLAVLKPWANLVRTGNLDCSYLDYQHPRPLLQGIDLSNYDVVLLDYMISVLQQPDLDTLNKYLASGGRVVIATDQHVLNSITKSNEFLAPYGLRMFNRKPLEDKLLMIEGDRIANHPVTAGVRKLKFIRPSVVSARDKEQGKILVPGLQAGLVAVASAGRGEVYVLSKSFCWYWIASPEEKDSDNARLLKNLLTRPRNKK